MIDEILRTNAGPWVGALSDSGVTVNVSAFKEVETASLVVARDQLASEDVRTFPARFMWEDVHGLYKHKVISFRAEDLDSDTEYFYNIELDGRRDRALPGRFRTAPPRGSRSSFRFACSGCAKFSRRKERPEAYVAIGQEPELLFFCHLGDLHYKNNDDEQIQSRLDDYDDALRRMGPGDLFRRLPTAYVWDDHDFLGNNSEGADPKRRVAATFARNAYQIYVPHYDLSSPMDGIYQVFEIGRVLFLLTDTRSQKSPRSGSGTSGKSMLGVNQKAWLKQQLLRGKNLDLIVWVNSIPWIGKPAGGSDFWAGYSDERREISNFIVSNEIQNICMISGDAHMVAIDDGSNSQYADESRGGFPVFQAAALESRGSEKGGPYSHGEEGGTPGKGIGGRRQYGLVEVIYESSDEPPRVRWTAKRAREGTPDTTTVLQHEFAAEQTFDGF